MDEKKKFAHGGLIQGPRSMPEGNGEWIMTGREWLMCKKCGAIFESYPGLNSHFCDSSGEPISFSDFVKGQSSSFAPINKETGKPYFALPEQGWDGTWEAGRSIHIPFPNTLKNRIVCFFLNLKSILTRFTPKK